MRYMLVAPDKSGNSTRILELTKDAFVVPIDTPQANDAAATMDVSFFVNAPDNVLCSVIPVIEQIEFDEAPEVELTEEMLEEFQERFARMSDPSDSLMETEFMINGVKVKLVN